MTRATSVFAKVLDALLWLLVLIALGAVAYVLIRFWPGDWR